MQTEYKWMKYARVFWLIMLMIDLILFISRIDSGSYYLSFHAFTGMCFCSIALKYLELPDIRDISLSDLIKFSEKYGMTLDIKFK
jgi:hypothetical protein